MTEAEWLQCCTPVIMLESIPGWASERKLRLFAVACCRRLLDQVQVSPHEKNGVEVAERFADGEASAEELGNAESYTYTEWAAGVVYSKADFQETSFDVESADFCAYMAVVSAPDREDYPAGADQIVCASCSAGQAWERQAQSHLIRDIFGSPFRPIAISPTIHTSTIFSLALAAYNERRLPSGELDSVRLAVLADALEEAGISQEMIDHLRGPGPHVRGCWAIDAILGKH
jgi:hypothetical protein